MAESTETLLSLAILLFFFWFIFFYRRSGRYKGHFKPLSTGYVVDQSDQLRVVQNADYAVRPLMNTEAVKRFYQVERAVRDINRKFRVFAELPLGAVLKSTQTSLDNEAFRAIHCKRIDIAVIDTRGYLVLAVEYHGTGHTLGNDFAHRDAVKRMALHKARIPLIELIPQDTAEDITLKIRRYLIADE